LARFDWKTWAFVAIPAVAIIELVAHARQTAPEATAEDWRAAREAVKSMVQPEDLVVVAPWWAEPIGRMHLGDEIMTLPRVARADVDRFPRAIEIAQGGRHTDELKGWATESKRDVGGLTIRVLKNPSPRKVIDDLVSHVGGKMKVFNQDQQCHWGLSGVDSGGIGHGPAVPAGRYNCPNGGFVSTTVLADLDYRPRRCIYAPRPESGGGSSVTKIVFEDVAFGTSLVGHHGIYVEAERGKNGAPVTIQFDAGGQTLGRAVHVDGDGWKGFELLTPPDLAGKRGELTALVSAPNGNRRMYCFEATTR
jgi:hypothetical protein